MRPYPQTVPGAYNWWDGNKFMIPPLGQPQQPGAPGVEDVLQQVNQLSPGVTGQAPVFPGGGSDGARGAIFDGSPQNPGGFGTQAGSLPGQGMNATTTSARDFAGALTTGPVGALTGVLGQMAYNGVMGRPEQPITQASLLSGIFGSGQDDFPGSGTLGSAANPGPSSPSVPGRGDGDNPFDAPDRGALRDFSNPDFPGSPSMPGSGDGPNPFDGSGPTPGDPTGGQGPANLYKGGLIRPGMLGGPNPPGPDDGTAYLKHGEMVVNAEATAKNRGLLEHMNKSKKKVSRGLLSR